MVKMKIGVRITSLFTACCITVTLAAGCSSLANSDNVPNSNTDVSGTSSANTNGVDTSKSVKLTGYLLGDEQQGLADVVAQLKDKLQKDINATMDLKYIGWGEMSSKYPAVLAAGTDIDWIFTAPWSYYNLQASKGAFLEITDDMIQKYMPLHSKATPKVAWEQCKIEGKIYMIPTSTPDQKCSAAVIRGDLIKKYNLPVPTKFSDLTDYFKAIKDNEPGMIPLDMDKQYDLGNVAGYLINDNIPPYVDILYTTGSGSGVIYDYSQSKISLTTEFDSVYAPGFITGYKGMKAWYDAGYINNDVFGNSTRSLDSFVQGRSGVAIGNSQDIQNCVSTAQSNGWDPIIIASLQNGVYRRDPYSGNGAAIAATSKNPERTLMALDYMMEEESYCKLLYYGIEGTNYKITSDNKIGLPDGVTADSNSYTGEKAGFWFISKAYNLPASTWPDSYTSFVKQSVPGFLVDDPLIAFAPNTDNIKTQVSNVNNAMIQYGNPLAAGAVKDVDQAWAELQKNVEAAGQKDILDEMTKQVNDYIASQNH